MIRLAFGLNVWSGRGGRVLKMSGLIEWGQVKNSLGWKVLGRLWGCTFSFGHAKFEVPVGYTREDIK